MAGLAATIGFVSFLDHEVSKSNSPLVDILLELGAVVYVKTNLPQTLMVSSTAAIIGSMTLTGSCRRQTPRTTYLDAH